MNSLRAYWLTCVLSMAAATLSATTIVMPSDEQLIDNSPVIVQGVVLSSTPVDRGGAIWTETTISVERSVKGNASGTIVVSEPGGVLEGRVTVIYGAPRYSVGERVLTFLAHSPRGDYQTIDLFVGKFTEGATLDGQRLWIRNDHEEHVSILDSDLNLRPALNVQRDGATFDNYVSGRVRGVRASTDYLVPNPALADSGKGGRIRIHPDFTLIDEPTVYRWTLFDNGGTAHWFSSGTQPGYGGGGANELRTAMAVWTTFPNARINYS